MKFFIAILLLAFVAIFFSFYNPRAKGIPAKVFYSKIKIGVNPDLLYKYLDYPQIEGLSDDTIVYDSSANRTYFLFNGPKAKHQKINVFSILSKNFSWEVSSQKDTTIQFDDNLYSNIKIGKLSDLSTLTVNEGDTIYIGYKWDGCFGSFKEKIVLYQTGNDYTMEYSNTTGALQKEIVTSSTFENRFRKFVTGLDRFLKPKEKTGIVKFTGLFPPTNYIRKGNIIYEFRTGNWKGYEIFKNEIGIK